MKWERNRGTTDAQTKREREKAEKLAEIEALRDAGQLRVRQMTKAERARGEAKRLTHPSKFKKRR